MLREIDSELSQIKTGNEKFLFLRKKYPKFIYEKFEYEINNDKKVLYIKFYFKQMQIDNKINELINFIEFNPTLKLSLNFKSTTKEMNFSNSFPNLKNKEILEKIIFNIGMIELISYWKACASPIIIIKPKFTLTNRQIKFWKEIYINGLGEYLYLNQINVSKKDVFEIIPNRKQTKNFDFKNKTNLKIYSSNNSKNLIPIGGGKDSIVSIELIKRMYKSNKHFLENNSAIILNPREATLKTAEIAGFNKDNIIIVKRIIDKNLLKLNSLGYLNGHTPFSALLSFITVLVSFTYGIKNIVLSNEDSASESNVIFNNLEINHQYSKSFKAEKELNWYIKKYLCKSINYFSLLRPLYEIQIASLFSRYASKYFKDFRSCNSGSKQNKWCLNCPKCLFVYIILSPFISQKQLTEEIFGENLLNRIELEEMFFELLGERENKPFECVGTYEEVKISMFLLNKNLLETKNNKNQLPILLTKFKKFYKEKEISLSKIESDSITIFNHFNNENLIPKKFATRIHKTIKKDNHI